MLMEMYEIAMEDTPSDYLKESYVNPDIDDLKIFEAEEDRDPFSNLKMYKNSLEKIAKSHVKDRFLNKDHQHAAIAMGVIMDNTEREFLLFDDDLSSDIIKHKEVSDFREKFEEMLKRGVETKVVISDKDTAEDDSDLKDFFKGLVKRYNNLSFKVASSDFKSAMKNIYGQKINFTIGDDDKFRLEFYGNKPVKDKARSAFISFQDKETVREAKIPFEEKFGDNHDYFNG